MKNRTGVYVAFNGCGTSNPTQSDIKYFNTLKSWKKNKDIDFTFVDSHEKTSSVKDTSDIEKTLLPRLKKRLNLSKVLILLVTENTLLSSEIVDYEIENAIDELNLPIIIMFAKKSIIKKKSQEMIGMLPFSLQIRLDDVPNVFIPFKLNALKEALNDYSVHISDLKNKTYTYSDIDDWDDL